MPGEVTFRIDGAKKMHRILEQLGPRIARRVAATALRAGTRPIVRRAKQLAPQPGSPDDPYATGEIRDAIGVELQRRTRPNKRVMRIGVRKPVSRRTHLLEFGAAHMPAEPFLRPALDEKKAEALAEMGRVLVRGIERAVARLKAR